MIATLTARMPQEHTRLGARFRIGVFRRRCKLQVLPATIPPRRGPEQANDTMAMPKDKQQLMAAVQAMQYDESYRERTGSPYPKNTHGS
jgi:hypothetical protein